MFHRSQPATWVDPFWPIQSVDTSIEDILSDEVIETEFSTGFDPYDPSSEDDLNTLTEDDVTIEEDFWFTTDSTHDSADEQSILREFVEQRSK